MAILLSPSSAPEATYWQFTQIAEWIVEKNCSALQDFHHAHPQLVFDDAQQQLFNQLMIESFDRSVCECMEQWNVFLREKHIPWTMTGRVNFELLDYICYSCRANDKHPDSLAFSNWLTALYHETMERFSPLCPLTRQAKLRSVWAFLEERNPSVQNLWRKLVARDPGTMTNVFYDYCGFNAEQQAEKTYLEQLNWETVFSRYFLALDWRGHYHLEKQFPLTSEALNNIAALRSDFSFVQQGWERTWDGFDKKNNKWLVEKKKELFELTKDQSSQKFKPMGSTWMGLTPLQDYILQRPSSVFVENENAADEKDSVNYIPSTLTDFILTQPHVLLTQDMPTFSAWAKHFEEYLKSFPNRVHWAQKMKQDHYRGLKEIVDKIPYVAQWRDENGNTLAHYLVAVNQNHSPVEGVPKIIAAHGEWIYTPNALGHTPKDLMAVHQKISPQNEQEWEALALAQATSSKGLETPRRKI